MKAMYVDFGRYGASDIQKIRTPAEVTNDRRGTSTVVGSAKSRGELILFVAKTTVAHQKLQVELRP